MTSTALTSDPTTLAVEVLAHLEAAWNDGDGPAFGRAYAADASFVTVRGEHMVGREAMGQGHDGIFRTIYAGSVNRMELLRAEEIAQGVVLAVSLNTLDCPAGPLAGRHQALSTSVVRRDADGDGSWLVAATHNTLVAR